MNTSKLLYPLKFQPIFKYRMWGGEKLRTVLGKKYEGDHIGESWEISDVKGDETRVMNGFLEGSTLRQLAEQYKGDFLGHDNYKKFGSEFPLLIKFIDAKTPLSIQVHPHDAIARERHNSFGKNEMWYVMAADESAEIIVGFNQELDKDVYLQKLEEGKILEVMNATKTSSGDVFHIPTGRVHAIGAGVLLAEIQQTSDITYRIYDYNRIDKKTGKTRDLHNELAIDVIDFKVQESYKTKYTNTPNQRNTMVHTPYFKTNIINLNKTKALDYSKTDSFIIHMCTNGKYSLEYQKEEYILQKGECIVIPAAIDHIIAEPKNTCEFLEVYL